MSSEEAETVSNIFDSSSSPDNSKPQSIKSSPRSIPSPLSEPSPSFRGNPISTDLVYPSSILGSDLDTVTKRFQESAEASSTSISTESSLSLSSNPLEPSSLPRRLLPKPNQTSSLSKATSSSVKLPTTTPTYPISTPPTTKVIGRMSSHRPTNIHELPIPGTKFAPKKFTGRYNRAKRFTDHYKNLISGITTITNQQKCELLLQYCSTKVSDFLEQLPSHRTGDFDQFIRDILNFYDASLSESRWKEKDLIKFVKQRKGHKVKTLSQWKAYNRRFVRVANWLLNNQLIDDNHYRTYYWDGIPKGLQEIFEARLLVAYPTQDLSKPFEVEKVQKIAEKYFMRDKFATLIADSEDSDSESETFESSDEEDSSSSSDSDDGYKKKRSKHHAKTKRKMDTYRKKLQAAKDEKGSSKSKQESSSKDSKAEELDDLINQLQKLSVDSPAYGIVYYKATKLDKDLVNCLKKPAIQSTSSYRFAKQFKSGDRVYHIAPTVNSNSIPLQNPNHWQQSRPPSQIPYNATYDD
jgi:hypothetical protein